MVRERVHGSSQNEARQREERHGQPRHIRIGRQTTSQRKKAEITAALQQSSEAALRGEITRFATWIGKVISEERERIQAERTKLQHLLQLRDRLRSQDAKLSELVDAASRESKGLCR